MGLLLLILCIAAYFIIYFYVRNKSSLHLQASTGIIFFSVIFLLGYIHLQNFNHRNYPDQKLFKSDHKFYLAVIRDGSEEKGNAFRSLAEIVKIKTDSGWQNSTGKVLLYHPSDPIHNSFNYGDMILVKGAALAVSPPANPGEFNYKKYLSYNHIYFQHFLRSGNYWFIREKAVLDIPYYLSSLRQKCFQVFQKHIKSKRERDIALALVLGIKSGLDNDVRDAYAAAGAMHVLAVSGLHVGMIYGIILFLLGKIKLVKGGRFIFAALALTILWIYAGITGLPASVLRAVTMFSVIIIAQAINRQTNIYNSLAIAALVLLIYDPGFLMSVGFQLSFLAVVGIVYFFPKIYHLIHPDHWLLDKIWLLTSVSIAAQLATFPISIYYFHQFPVYFFLSNLIVIPAAFVILGSGLAVLVMSFSETITQILSFVLENIIFLVNQTVFALDYIPYHLIKDLHLDPLQTILIYSFIIFLASFIHLKDQKHLWLAGLSFIFFTGTWLNTYLNQMKQHKIVFYNIANLTAIDFIEGHTGMLWLGEDAGKHLSKLQFHVMPGRINSGLSTEVDANYREITSKFPSSTVKGAHLLVFNQNKILLMDQSINMFNNNFHKVSFDYLVVRNNYKESIDDLLQQVNFKKLVIDGSNSFFNASRMEAEAEKLGLDYHSTRTMGALVVDLNY